MVKAVERWRVNEVLKERHFLRGPNGRTNRVSYRQHWDFNRDQSLLPRITRRLTTPNRGSTPATPQRARIARAAPGRGRGSMKSVPTHQIQAREKLEVAVADGVQNVEADQINIEHRPGGTAGEEGACERRAGSVRGAGEEAGSARDLCPASPGLWRPRRAGAG